MILKFQRCVGDIGDNDDVFIDSLDDDFSHEEDQTNPLKPCFTELKNYMEEVDFNSIIKVPVNKTIGEVVMMVIRYAIVYALSLSQVCDLLKLVNCIFTSPILASTRYLIDKMFYPKNDVQLHRISKNCKQYFGKFTREDRIVKCTICRSNNKVNDSSYNDNFFVTLNTSLPIAA